MEFFELYDSYISSGVAALIALAASSMLWKYPDDTFYFRITKCCAILGVGVLAGVFYQIIIAIIGCCVAIFLAGMVVCCLFSFLEDMTDTESFGNCLKKLGESAFEAGVATERRRQQEKMREQKSNEK